MYTVGQGSTFELRIYFCGVMLLTADNVLYLVRVIYPSLETYDDYGTPRNVLPCNSLMYSEPYSGVYSNLDLR